MLKKCEVLVDRVSLVIGKGSVVFVDDRQFEVAKQFLKPLNEAKPVEESKPVINEENSVDEVKPLEKEVRTRKKKK